MNKGGSTPGPSTTWTNTVNPSGAVFYGANAVGAGLARQRANNDRIDQFTIKASRISGFELVVGTQVVTNPPTTTNEVVIDVSFSVMFTEKPAMSFGAELEEGQVPEALNLPTVSVVVLSWVKAHEDRVGGGQGTPGWFTGARLAVVTGGRFGQRIWIHWQAEGKAIRNPAAPADPGQT